MSSRSIIPFCKRAAIPLAAILLAYGCARQEAVEGKTRQEAAVPADAGTVGSKAPDFELVDLSGKKVRLSDFKGKPVIVDFWATWCPPCRAEVPDFVRLQSKYRAQGLVILGLSLDAEGEKAVRPFAEEHDVNYPLLLADDDTARLFGGVIGIPTTFVIDREGRIVQKYIGKTELKTFEEAIKPLVTS